MNVLIGVDGSANSFAAVEFVAGLLSPEADRITLYYSPPPISQLTKSGIESDVLENVQESLGKAVYSAAEKHIPEPLRETMETVTGTQKTAHGILIAADESRADLIVVGAHGTSSQKTYGVGSVTRHVVHSARVPVLVVRPRSNEAASIKVLLACDGSESSTNAGKLLHEFDWGEETTGRMITVVESLVAGHLPDWLVTELRSNTQDRAGAELLERIEEQSNQARENLKSLAADLPSIFRDTEPIVAQGRAASQIVQSAKDENADLIVLGARRLGPLGRMFLGSTSDYALTHTSCSVLIVHERERP